MNHAFAIIDNKHGANRGISEYHLCFVVGTWLFVLITEHEGFELNKTPKSFANFSPRFKRSDNPGDRKKKRDQTRKR
jgi:hypothetical protein